jgi:hypothetical protein
MASSGTPDGEGWRSGGPQHGEQNMHTRPPSAPEVPHATNLRGATPPIVPLMSRFSLGWSVVAAFTAGALTFYTVRSWPFTISLFYLFIYLYIYLKI